MHAPGRVCRRLPSLPHEQKHDEQLQSLQSKQLARRACLHAPVLGRAHKRQPHSGEAHPRYILHHCMHMHAHSARSRQIAARTAKAAHARYVMLLQNAFAKYTGSYTGAPPFSLEPAPWHAQPVHTPRSTVSVWHSFFIRRSDLYCKTRTAVATANYGAPTAATGSGPREPPACDLGSVAFLTQSGLTRSAALCGRTLRTASAYSTDVPQARAMPSAVSLPVRTRVRSRLSRERLSW
jgi:hypothetical protein